jgi:hypothetical protein
MCNVLVGRGIALHEWLATLLLASRPVWHCQPYMYPEVAAARIAGGSALVTPINSLILVTTLWKTNVSATGVD